MAGDFVCTTVAVGTFDNVIVPEGAICDMGPATVRGSVKVFGGLNVVPPTTIRGSIDGEPGHDFVALLGGAIVVRGSVQLKGSPGAALSGYIAGIQIGGNFQYEENANGLVAQGAIIRGNLKAEKNTGGGTITGNTIRGNLECKENSPPMVEVGNTIGGDDKCPED
jgi:hypothetical protein